MGAMAMKSFAPIVGLLVLCSVVQGQTLPPALMIQRDGHSVPLGLTKLQTEVRVVGAIAETTTTMTFANPMDRVMEGYLYFPLPEGATVNSYALDINGTMVDGVAVEKYEARRIFEELEHRRIDPGLVEWTKANTFQTRVFPLPAHGQRIVRVGYVSELTCDEQGNTYRLALPKKKFPEFSLKIEVVKPTDAPHLAKGALPMFAFAKWHNSFVAETTLRDWQPGEDLIVSLPKVDHRQVTVEKAGDGQFYFAVNAEPEAAWNDLPAAPVKRVVVFWDASGSRAGEHQREIALLGQILAARVQSNGPSIRKITVDLVLVRNATTKPVRLRFSKPAIAAALQGVVYDGGTQLGAVAPPSGAEKPDLYFLFTDGCSTFGKSEPAQLDAPLEVFSTSTDARHAWLQRLAAENGGHYFDLSQETDADVLASLNRPPWAFLSATVNGDEAKDLYPRLPYPSADRLILVGKLAAGDAKVTLRYGVKGGESREQSFQISAANADEGSLLRSLWAQKQLADLMVDAERNKDEILALGEEFGLVTPFTSLLVLDSLAQYIQYGVPPPKSLPEVREQYLKQIGNLDFRRRTERAQRQREHVQARRAQANQLVELNRLWQQHVEWWEKKFKYSLGFKYVGESKPDAAKGKTPRTPTRGAAGNAGAGMGGAMGGSGANGAGGAGAAMGGSGAHGSGGGGGAGMNMGGMGMGGMGGATGSTHSGRTSRSSGRHRDTPRDTASPANVPAQVRTGDLRDPWNGSSNSLPSTFAIQEWTPDAACLKELAAAKKGKAELWDLYVKHRATFKHSPAFFLDFSDRLREAGKVELALQVLSNIAEMELDDATVLRAFGNRLLHLKQTDAAVRSFERTLDLRPNEPQSYRDLAIAIARRANEAAKSPSHSKDAVRDDYARAIDLFAGMFQSRTDVQLSPIGLIALEEVNQIIPKAKAAGVSPIRLPSRLVRSLDMDVRIVISWLSDGTNVDPAITEPTGEVAYDQHRLTTIGGLISLYSSQGYGLEEYALRKAAPGKYKIDIDYYGSGTTRLLGATAVQVDVFTNYGRPSQRHESLLVRLQPSQQTINLGEIEFPTTGSPTIRMP
jgi:hypothetical protein